MEHSLDALNLDELLREHQALKRRLDQAEESVQAIARLSAHSATGSSSTTAKPADDTCTSSESSVPLGADPGAAPEMRHAFAALDRLPDPPHVTLRQIRELNEAFNTPTSSTAPIQGRAPALDDTTHLPRPPRPEFAAHSTSNRELKVVHCSAPTSHGEFGEINNSENSPNSSNSSNTVRLPPPPPAPARLNYLLEPALTTMSFGQAGFPDLHRHQTMRTTMRSLKRADLHLGSQETLASAAGSLLTLDEKQRPASAGSTVDCRPRTLGLIDLKSVLAGGE